MERMKRMRWIDGHCDVLWKMWESPGTDLLLRCGNPAGRPFYQRPGPWGWLQVFAMFVSPKMPKEAIWDAVLRQVDLFHEEIVGDGREVAASVGKPAGKFDGLTGKMGGLLSLEGADALQGELYHCAFFTA